MNYIKGEHGSDTELGRMECGCIIFQRTSQMFGASKILIQYCPKHSDIFEAYEALKGLVKAYICNPDTEGEFIACIGSGHNKDDYPDYWKKAIKSLADMEDFENGIADTDHYRFQNTLTNLQDCWKHITDGDISKEEDTSRDKLITLCEQIAEYFK
jgi:hypothetical protein